MRMIERYQSHFSSAMEKWGRTRKFLGCLLLFFLLVPPTPIRAADIDIYTNNSQGVEPNVLIIFDNSKSMEDSIPVALYDHTITYPNHLGIDRDSVYYRNLWGSWDDIFKSSIGDITCPEANAALQNQGFFNGRVEWDGSCGNSWWDYKMLRTGNYRNYLKDTEDDDVRRKVDIAKEVIKDFVMSTNGIRMGAMAFNWGTLDEYDDTKMDGGRIHDDGSYECTIQDMGEDESDPNYANREALRDAIDAIDIEYWTPLAETLYEAGLYFQGQDSHFNTGTYTSPITYWCQKNYVIIITDGDSTKDIVDLPVDEQNAILAAIGNNGDVDGDGNDPGSYPNNGSDYLDDVAQYLYDADLSPLGGKQNVITYTIGFTVDTQLLQIRR